MLRGIIVQKSAHLHQMNQNADKAIAGLVKAAMSLYVSLCLPVSLCFNTSKCLSVHVRQFLARKFV